MSTNTLARDEAPDATISFRCNEGWKRQVASAVALRGETMQNICVEALSKYLKIAPPQETA